MPRLPSICRHRVGWVGLLLAATANFAVAEEPVVAPAARHQQGNAQSVAFSPDGRLVAAGFGGPVVTRDKQRVKQGRIVVWEAATGKLVHQVEAYGDVVGLQFASDGRSCLVSRVYTPGDSVDDNVSRLIPIGDGEETRLSFGRMSYLATLSPTSGQFAIVKGRDIAQVFDSLAADEMMGEVHELSIVDSYSASALAFASDGKTFAAVHGRLEPILRKDGTLALRARAIRNDVLTLFETTTWSVQDSVVNEELLDCTALAVSRDARWIATGHPGGIARVWDGRTLQKKEEMNLQAETAVLPRFAPDGKRLALLTQPSGGLTWRRSQTPSGFTFERQWNQTPCELALYEAKEFQLQRTFRLEDAAFATYHANRPRASLNPARLAFSPDGNSILVGCNGVTLLDAETGETIRQFDLPHEAP
ncbi:WD40 repeat domain-containing protein [Blastopirellula retiformator]|uniref:WD domain, G-beta repeat n=1 Tax=Blastopirellula retiformator TaxID=2527970 RepID=A0A5C5VJ02_9BACT|nr:WD40 repeat domain-containing protein [Blastopirellula retiformator]TWT38624.1 hypothetical protein Enr8_03170 [Blastopirellula retiformator]